MLQPLRKDGMLVSHRKIAGVVYSLGEDMPECKQSGKPPSPQPGPEARPMSEPCSCGWTGWPAHTHRTHKQRNHNKERDCD